MKLIRLSITASLITFLAFLGACGYAPTKPSILDSPDSPVILDPELAEIVGIPATQPPIQSSTADGRLTLIFHLQNNYSRTASIAYKATFYDEASVPVDDQGQLTAFLKPAEIKPFTVTSSSSKARKVTVQVYPTR